MSVKLDEIETSVLHARAKRAWSLMDDNEKACVRFGMAPLWTIQKYLGGKDNSPLWGDITKNGEAGRIMTLALFTIAKQNGGMVA